MSTNEVVELFLERTPDLILDPVEIAKIGGAIYYVQSSEVTISNDGTFVHMLFKAGDDWFRRAVPMSSYRRSLSKIRAFVRNTERQVLHGEIQQPEMVVSTFHSGGGELHLASPWTRFCNSHKQRAEMLRGFDFAASNKVVELRH